MKCDCGEEVIYEAEERDIKSEGLTAKGLVGECVNGHLHVAITS